MESFKEIIESETPTLVDFYASWCAPCKAMAPVLDQLKNQLGETVRIIKIDVDKNQSVADKFKIRGVPTFILFKNDQIVWRQSGGIDLDTLIVKIKTSI
ncbi:MAG: thioredoxin [Crocinitomicaceae bacterium]